MLDAEKGARNMSASFIRSDPMKERKKVKKKEILWASTGRYEANN